MSFNDNSVYVFTLLLLLLPIKMQGQIDSSYIKAFDQDFSARSYINHKFFAFDKRNDNDRSQEYTLMTNSPVSIGVGASWKIFSFGFSQGFDFMRDKKKGKTHSLEFQHHGYGRKIVYDLILQHHKGFYNEQQNKDGSYMLYRDIKLNYYGGGLYYVFNNKKISYKAAFNQNERQIKSAGSFILGSTAHYSRIRTDSTTLFEGMQKTHENLQIGVSLGYAHTWVISREWFMTGSATIGISMGNNYPNSFFKKRMSVYPIVDSRFAVGYNAYNWSLGFSSHLNNVYLFHDEKESLSMLNAIFRITFIYRFDWGNKFVNETLNMAKDKLRM